MEYICRVIPRYPERVIVEESSKEMEVDRMESQTNSAIRMEDDRMKSHANTAKRMEDEKSIQKGQLSSQGMDAKEQTGEAKNELFKSNKDMRPK